jgi:hypothetical protein
MPGVDIADKDVGLDTTRTPMVATVTTDGTPSNVGVAWVGVNTANALALLGDPTNHVALRRSTDGGNTFGSTITVSRTRMDSPVVEPPWIVMTPHVLHVLYVTGGLLGVWNVVLATSSDGGMTWAYRTVNDDDPCATHAIPAMALDPGSGDAHVIFLDNRFGPGEVVYARCPADPSQRCSRNAVVSSTPFVMSTTTDPSATLGTHSALLRASDGTLWAAWTDTRTGGPGIYVAHLQP